MGDLKSYEVELNGVKTHVQLDEEEAERRGLLKPAAKKAAKPANKGRTPKNK